MRLIGYYYQMIISSTPLRISFIGGGTDLPWYYEKYDGGVVSITFDKYVYLSIHSIINTSQIVLKYSKTEIINSPDEILHPIMRIVLSDERINGIDICVTSDIPSGTGLGSSSSFTVGLINLINAYKGKYTTPEDLASKACEIEIFRLNETIGKQDQYAAAFGGINQFKFSSNGSVSVNKIFVNKENLNYLNSSLILVSIGGSRLANKILSDQVQFLNTNPNKTKDLHELVSLIPELIKCLTGNISDLGRIVDEGWALKKSSSPTATNSEIDELISYGKKSGADGAKLLGAGNAGFVLFIVKPEKMNDFINKINPRQYIRPSLVDEGSKIIYAK